MQTRDTWSDISQPSDIDVCVMNGHHDLYFTVQCFALYLDDHLMDEHQTFG